MENIVKEHINFERSINPKSAMNTGIKAIREFDTIDDAALFFVNNIEALTNGEYNTKNIFEQPNKDRKDIPSLKPFYKFIKGEYVNNIPITIKQKYGSYEDYPDKLGLMSLFANKALEIIKRNESENYK